MTSSARSWFSACVRALVALRCSTFRVRSVRDRPVVGLGGGVDFPGQHHPSGRDRVDDVGLAVPAADLPVGSHHFHHGDLLEAQVSGQRHPVGAGALDSDPVEVAKPRIQLSSRR